MRKYLEFHWKRALRWLAVSEGAVLFEAFMIATAIAMMAVSMMMGKKGKKGANTDPVIGKRYWSDNIEAFAYYSPRTAKLWFNQIFLNQEELFSADYIPMTQEYGDTFDIGAQAVNTGAVSGFTIPYPGSGMPMSYFDTIDEKRRLCKIVEFSRGKGQNPRLPTHQPGVAAFYVNQGYMGLNTANVGNYRAILTAYPGTVYMLQAQGGEYADEGLWVRYRDTTDCGTTLCVNPICIILDIILDRYPVDEVDFLSAADVGKRLLQEKPYMWFSLAQPPQKYKQLLKDLAKKSSIAIRRTPEGKVGFRLIGETPPGGIESVRELDVVHEAFEVSIEKPSIENADIINEARGTYLAARYDAGDFIPYRDTIEGASEYEIMLQSEADYSNKKAAYENALNTHGEFDPVTVAAKQDMDAAEIAANNARGLFTSNKEAHDAHEGMKEGHFLKGGTFAVNPANIVLTGIRSQKNYNLDFINWPDDAKAYLEDALLMYEHPLSSGVITTSFAFNDLEVGNLFKLMLHDEPSGLDYRFIAEIGEKTVLGFGEERVRLSFKESGKWFNVIAGDPNVSTNPGPVDGAPVTGTYSRLLPMWSVATMLSPLMRGFPMVSFAGQQNTDVTDGVNYYLVTGCLTGTKDENNWLCQDVADMPNVGILQHDYTPTSRHPGASCDDQITLRVPIDAGSDRVTMANIFRNKADMYGGVMNLFHDEAHYANNYIILTKGSVLDPTNDAGVGYLFRAANISVQEGIDELIVTIGGLYACDLEHPEITFNEGDYVVLLPNSNQVVEYGYASAPVPASVGHTNQIGTQTFKVKTVPAKTTEDLTWFSCKCGIYDIDDRWLDTVPCAVMASNVSKLSMADPEVAVYADADDTVVIWIALHDQRRLGEDANMMGIVRAFPGSGPEHDVSINDTPTVNDSRSSDGGVSYADVTIEYIDKATDTVLDSVNTGANKLKHEITPAELMVGFSHGDIIKTRVTIGYTISSNSVLDQNTTLRTTTIDGPEIRHG